MNAIRWWVFKKLSAIGWWICPDARRRQMGANPSFRLGAAPPTEDLKRVYGLYLENQQRVYPKIITPDDSNIVAIRAKDR